MNRVCIAFAICVKHTENTVPLQEDWKNMTVMVLSLDLFLLSLQNFIGGRMFPIHATFAMMICNMIIDIFVLQEHINRLLS